MESLRKNLLSIRQVLIGNRYQILVIAVVIALVTAFVTWYVLNEKTIFFWDNSAYWIKTNGLTNWIENSPKAALVGVIESVQRDEYNLLFAVPLTVINELFGESRLVYILGIFGLYYIPATFLLALICHKLTSKVWNGNRLSSSWQYVVTWLYVVLNPFVILPILGGYPDIIGLIPLSIAFLLYIQKRSSIQIKHLVLIGILLLIATLLRRWYIFGAAGLMLTVCFDQLVLLRAWRMTKQKAVSILKLTALPFTFISLFTVIAYDYISKLLTTDYSTEYAAYKFHDNYFELGSFIFNHYGVLLSILVVTGLVGLVIKKKVNRTLIVAVLLSQLFAFIAVGRVQTFDTHQYYLLTIGVLLGINALPFIFGKYKPRIMQPLTFTLAASVLLGSWVSMYGSFHPSFGFSDVKEYPESRSDIATLKKIYADVDKYDTSPRPIDTIYVLACSFRFNIDLFRNIPISTNGRATIEDSRFTPSAIFDVAQGFDKGFFTSDIVVDSTPVGYITTNEREQQVITILHNELLMSGKLRPYYQLMENYDIDGGYKVSVLKRVADIPEDVKDNILMQITRTHTDPVPIVD